MNILRSGNPARKGRHQKRTSTGPGDKTAFPLAVPDYVQADWFMARLRPRPSDDSGRPKRGRPRVGALHWAVHHAVIVQKASRVILADVVLAQVVWGGDRRGWPRNWRQLLVQRLMRAVTLNLALLKVVHREVDLGERGCPAGCALHGTPVRHQHLEITIATPAADPDAAQDDEPSEPEYCGTFLGALEVFGYEDSPDRAYHWAPRPFPPEPAEGEEAGEREAHHRLLGRINGLKRAGRLAAVYLPLKLFGASPRLGLSWRERNLHQAITRELTRGKDRARSGRQDRAEVVIGGQAPDGAVTFVVSPCPYQEKGKRYVGFNGNGGRRRKHLRGRGYKPLVWMRKAAYDVPEASKPLWRQVRTFLGDLGRLATLFGLVVAAWHPKECAWRQLAELPPLTRASGGRAWLRVYAEDDFLVRWRRLFAARMGFSVIPDTAQEEAAQPQSPIVSREAFQAYLSRKGVSPAELARQMGLSRSQVSRHLSGGRGWSASWTKRVTRWLAGEGSAGSKVATHSH
jgi:hypothetical protein